MELLALGPLELWHDGRQYGLGSLQERRVLLILIHARCEPVSVDTLTDRVWNGEPPPTAVETLQSYLSRLRGRLRGAVGDEQAWVGRVSPRLYQLRAADAEDIDLLRFQRLRTDAAAAAGRGEHELAIGLLRTAESMWRGEPLREFGDNDWAASARSRLVEDHRRVREERIGLEMELGRHDDLVGELRELASQNPFAQKVLASLMLALYRCGRHDEALAVYRDLRGRLHETQGIEPGAELQELHLRMLEQDRTLMRTRGSAEAVAPAGSEPRNCLPRDTADFTGRVGELRILLARENDPAGPPGEAYPLPVTVLHGMPGIGKTALAVRAAHRLRAAYPDGQFYVDLRGYSSEQPLDPAEALALLLHSAGWSGELPATPDERAARWREWTARHRAVVLLDNARDAAQVAPLLPGTPACRAIVTTRSRLAGLDGATFLRVDALSRAEAKALFTRIVGSSRTSAEPEALERVVDASACHPLALQLLASRFRHRESWVLQDLLDRLAHAADPLAEFDDQVRAAFQVSYAELGTAARTLLRRLALHPGPDITLAAAAALAGPEFEETPGLLAGCVEELLDASLLEDPVRGRHRLHDLTRAFGLRSATPADRAALPRLLAHHLTTAHRADRTAHPHRRTVTLPAALEQDRHAPHFADADEASVWLTVERSNLLAVARTAAARYPEYAALFPAVLARSLKLWGTWDLTADLFDAALPALRASGDRAALAHTLTAHADLLAQRNHAEALRRATEALSLCEDMHDTLGRADALLQCGRAHLAAGHSDRAMQALDRALTLYRETRDRSGEAECLNVQGALMYFAGQYEEALHRVQLMQTIYEELPDPYGLAQALNNRGELASLQGRHDEARACYEGSLQLMRGHGGPKELAILATNLGGVHQATGRTDLALSYYRRALDAHRSSGDVLGEAAVLVRLGLAHARSGRRGEALLHLAMAQRVATSIDNPFERLRALLATADVQRESGRTDIAFKSYEEALAVARDIDVPLGTAQALDGLTRTTGSAQEAHMYGEQAIALYRGLGADTEAERLLKLLTGHKSTGS
ncbi:AfsR/SARP family transcriptional regulator [Streptomyces cylindrosporus]|uniref:Tetratricopeptide repeat protein n=1 Tax=Streptomyces cylindrosporus TaxID=2927583 RepID=A0ABS9YNH8_9ACTN|nr:BTAD domain-containing putative transcriptional regulator [Streptomyces cylindrosporus]MCI3277381.1 tetratricopeptide repeat protein [Streptomyces cylindrosporus]